MKIALIVISYFVFLVVPHLGWTGDCSPLQISLFPPYQLVPAEKDVCGLRLNLPVGDNHNIYGLDLGFLGHAWESKGIQLNLIANIVLYGLPSVGGDNSGSSTKGIQIGGFGNLNFGDIDGIQIAGVINIGNIQGIQIAGLWNGGGEVRGLQIAGLFNGAGEAWGIQVAAVNYSEKATGLQCGLYNGAKSVRGIQMGLINLTQELSGLQIGLVNYIRESPVPILPIINLKF